MSALEQELIDKIRAMDEEHKLRVLEWIRQTDESEFDFDAWMQKARAFRRKLRAKYGENFRVNSQSLLDEAREERMNALIGRH